MVSFKLFSLASLAFLAQSVFSAPTSENIADLAARTGQENVGCYNIGTKSDRAPIVNAVNNFCNAVTGQTFSNGRAVEYVYAGNLDFDIAIFVKAQVINGCTFVVDGNCARLLMKAVDSCNTSGENGKQGGVLTDACGQWTVDPGRWSTGDHF
ncbi:hypothetical protein BDV93DRAFT_611084 [Ceratobasidium sp. AG-I]|nr:hypothetical protein BDV93DRAFT_611084 [Ceratobasidium sp. AG-I]